ncbi:MULTISPECIES: AMP-binding protein [Rhodopseudomonas]|uniref:AMP-binding protein n=1 Tax=Rhodopseudomonas TaxID=1073 RepID=UPI0005C95809|nr:MULTISPECIES: AMP-binding protein [Rhodopseudomonas]MDF3813741.1 AMP-binding protein [Rhodopseudomonas sp. BAL398]WOK17629.1 AMP-binding protein [Rhodopseudomonas sp. BAL398]
MSDELRRWAQTFPEKAAWRLADGSEELSFGELDLWSSQTMQWLAACGVITGDVIAMCLPNCAELFAIAWAARRLGAYFTPISIHLKPDEAAYILADSGARVYFATTETAYPFNGRTVLVTPGLSGSPYERARQQFGADVDLPERPLGKDFVYSSGTTGQPKGVKRPLFADPERERRQAYWIQAFSNHDETSVCLTPAPLYHAAPLRFAMRAIQYGGTVIGMRKFHAETALDAIQTWKVTHSLWVPTMFYRMLRLPETRRAAYDLSSMRCAIHSGGPCAADLKQQMIAWWGPIIWEYYAASEGNGATCISSTESLRRPGAVGRAALGKIHIVGPDGSEVAAGQTGEVYFEYGPTFEYHNDPIKTAASRNDRGWTTVGDIGHLDSEGYLFLSDRKAHTIVSGGVNIYPLEIEQLLCRHPAVADAAVFGVPNQEYGEEVVAVIELMPEVRPAADLRTQLDAYCREHLSAVKRPKQIVFESCLPRGDNGKLSKVALRQRFLINPPSLGVSR